MNRLASFAGILLMLCCMLSTLAIGSSSDDKPLACVNDLGSMALPALARKYRQTGVEPRFEFVTTLARPGQRDTYSERYYASGVSEAATYILSYKNSGLRQYARLDIPSSVTGSLPVLVYAHGYVGFPESLTYALAYDAESMSGEFIARWVQSGFAVLSPGYRGHGTFEGLPAEGAEFLALWDNGGTFLTPTFYAQDVLAAIDALPSLHGIPELSGEKIATDAITLLGHSQGGDVALTALAIDALAGRTGPAIVAASIWAGCIGNRVEQLNFYRALQTTRRAFMAGDDIWRRSARGEDGSVNTDFLWPWPQDWTPGLMTDEHGWQPDPAAFSGETVASVQARAHNRVMETVRECTDSAKLADVLAQINAASGTAHASAIKIPVSLHTSNQDFYSPPRWNRALAATLNEAGAQARVFIYPANTHALKTSNHSWFSPAGTVDGLPQALAHDAALFRSELAGYRSARRTESQDTAPQPDRD